MCRRVTCNSCGKPTWAGCGAHIEQVLGDLPKSARCNCRETKAAAAKKSATAAAPPKDANATTSEPKAGGIGAFFKRIIGG